MKIKIKCIKFLSILLVSVFTLFAACSSQSSQQSSQAESSQAESESEDIPSDLTELENNIEMIVKTLDGPAVQVNQETQQSGGGGTQSEQSNQGGNQSQQEGQSSQQGQGQQQSQPSSSTPQDPMEKISPIIEKLHYQWNNLMPMVIKKDANKDLVNNFDNALNNLSNTVISKSKINTLIAANQLYSYIPDLYLLFKSKPSPEIKRVRYYSRSAILNALAAQWTQADSDIDKLKSVWVLYKNTVSKEQQDTANKLDLSIYELEKVIKERNQTLVNIKGKVEFSNIEDLEKASESESGGQSGGQESSGG